ALAQGLLLNDALGALRAIGIDVSRITPGGRRLVVDGGDLEFVLARPSDIATYVERGAADLGIVGKDVLMETGARVVELVDLRFGACRFVVAAARGSSPTRPHITCDGPRSSRSSPGSRSGRRGREGPIARALVSGHRSGAPRRRVWSRRTQRGGTRRGERAARGRRGGTPRRAALRPAAGRPA